MTSTNDGKDVKSDLTSAPRGKEYYVNIYTSLDASLNGSADLPTRCEALCLAWARIHCLCAHSAAELHDHLTAWLQRHTARILLQTEWQQHPSSAELHANLHNAIDGFVEEASAAAARRDASFGWESTLSQRGDWFKRVLADPWGHPVLKQLLDQRGDQPHDDDVLEWLKGERGVVFATRLRQLVKSSQCYDLALFLATAVMDRVRGSAAWYPDCDDKKTTDTENAPNTRFGLILRDSADFTREVWELLVDIEFVLLHKLQRTARCIELAKQAPLWSGYQLVERLRTRPDTSPSEKKLWKNAKSVATIIAQVIITRCMITSVCADVPRRTLYFCSRSLVKLVPEGDLPSTASALTLPAATACHLHTLAYAVEVQCKDTKSEQFLWKPFVCELYVRAITTGMNELEKLKLKTEKDSETRTMEQTLSSWFLQLGALLATSNRINCECVLTAFSVHPSPKMYDRLRKAPSLPELYSVSKESSAEPKTEFGSWANDSRSQTNLVKTSETLNMKHNDLHQANVLSTAILTEGEGLGLNPELCQDIAVLLSGPRVKTLSWDMDREQLLANCRSYMERTSGGTRALTTELKYLNLDLSRYQHLPEEDEGEDDLYYGIEKGYEHLVELPEAEPEKIWADALSDGERTTSACSAELDYELYAERRMKNRPSSSDESDPLSEHKAKKERSLSKERANSKERSKPKQKKEASREPLKEKPKKEKRERKKKEKPSTVVSDDASRTASSLANLIGLKVCKSNVLLPTEKNTKVKGKRKSKKPQRIDVESDTKDRLNHPIMTSLETPESEVQFDGIFSMDDLKTVSPEKIRPESNLSVVYKESNIPVNVNTYQSPHSSTSTKSDDSKSIMDTNVNLNCGSPANDEVKQRIAKLLQYRKQKSFNSPKTIETKSSPKDKTPKQQGPKILNVTSDRYAINRALGMTPVDFIKTQCPQLQMVPIKKDSPLDATGSHNDLDESVKQALKLTNLQTTPTIPKPTKILGMTEYLTELHSAGGGSKPELSVRRLSKDSSPNTSLKVASNTDTNYVKSETVNLNSSNPHCAKPFVPLKKAENALNTFSRLNYMHKNKQIDTKTKQNLDFTRQKTLTEQEFITYELNRNMKEFQLARMKMCNNNISMERISTQGVSTTSHTVSSASIEQISPSKYVSSNPVLAGILKSPEKTANTSLFKDNVLNEEISKTPLNSSMAHIDQSELFNLMKQNNKLNAVKKDPQNSNKMPNDMFNTESPKREPTTISQDSSYQNRFVLEKIKSQNEMLTTLQQSNQPDVKSSLSLKNPVKIESNKNSKGRQQNKSRRKKDQPNSSYKTKPDKIQQDLNNVFDVLRATKTPRRGHNALEMTLKDRPETMSLLRQHRHHVTNSSTVMKKAIEKPPISASDVIAQMKLSQTSHDIVKGPVKPSDANKVPKAGDLVKISTKPHYIKTPIQPGNVIKIQNQLSDVKTPQKPQPHKSNVKKTSTQGSDFGKMMAQPNDVIKIFTQPNNFPKTLIQHSSIAKTQIKSSEIPRIPTQRNDLIKIPAQSVALKPAPIIAKPKTPRPPSAASSIQDDMDKPLNEDLFNEYMDSELLREINELSYDGPAIQPSLFLDDSQSLGISNSCSSKASFTGASSKQKEIKVTFPVGKIAAERNKLREKYIGSRMLYPDIEKAKEKLIEKHVGTPSQTLDTEFRTQSNPASEKRTLYSNTEIRNQYSNKIQNQECAKQMKYNEKVETVQIMPAIDKAIMSTPTPQISSSLEFETPTLAPVANNVQPAQQFKNINVNNQMKTAESTNVLLASVPISNNLTNVVLLTPNIMSYSAVQVQNTVFAPSICDVNQSTYLVNTPNIALYQSTQYAAPAVNHVIVGNAITNTDNEDSRNALKNYPKVDTVQTVETMSIKPKDAQMNKDVNNVTNKISNEVANKVCKVVSNKVSNEVDNRVSNKVASDISHNVQNMIKTNVNDSKTVPEGKITKQKANVKTMFKRMPSRQVLTEVKEQKQAERRIMKEKVRDLITKSLQHEVDRQAKLEETKRIAKKRSKIINRLACRGSTYEPIALKWVEGPDEEDEMEESFRLAQQHELAQEKKAQEAALKKNLNKLGTKLSETERATEILSLLNCGVTSQIINEKCTKKTKNNSGTKSKKLCSKTLNNTKTKLTKEVTANSKVRLKSLINDVGVDKTLLNTKITKTKKSRVKRTQLLTNIPLKKMPDMETEMPILDAIVDEVLGPENIAESGPKPTDVASEKIIDFPTTLQLVEDSLNKADPKNDELQKIIDEISTQCGEKPDAALAHNSEESSDFGVKPSDSVHEEISKLETKQDKNTTENSILENVRESSKTKKKERISKQVPSSKKRVDSTENVMLENVSKAFKNETEEVDTAGRNAIFNNNSSLKVTSDCNVKNKVNSDTSEFNNINSEIDSETATSNSTALKEKLLNMYETTSSVLLTDSAGNKIKVQHLKTVPASKGVKPYKLVRISMANGKSFQVTIYGAVNIDFESFVSDPKIKDIITNNATVTKKYKLNIKHTATKGELLKVEDAQEIPLHPKEIETIDLISDEEGEKEEKPSFDTEFGIYKANKKVETPEKHQDKFNQKCVVRLLRRNDSYFENITSHQTTENIAIDKVCSEVCETDQDDVMTVNLITDEVIFSSPTSSSSKTKVDEIDVYKEFGLTEPIPSVNYSAPLIPETTTLDEFVGIPSDDLPEVIDVDDSSNDELDSLLKMASNLNIVMPEPNLTEPEEKINVLKNQLLNDLDVLIADSSTDVVKEPQLPDIDEKLCKQSVVKLIRCDGLYEKYKVMKKCKLELIKCDNDSLESTVNNAFEENMTQLPIIVERSESPSILCFNPWDSQSSVKDLELLDLGLLPLVDSDSLIEASQREGRTSPVIEVFDVIAQLNNPKKYICNSERLLKCDAEWFTTKFSVQFAQKVDQTKVNRNIYKVTSLLTIVLNFFENHDVLSDMRPLINYKHRVKSSRLLKRKSILYDESSVIEKCPRIEIENANTKLIKKYLSNIAEIPMKLVSEVTELLGTHEDLVWKLVPLETEQSHTEINITETCSKILKENVQIDKEEAIRNQSINNTVDLKDKQLNEILTDSSRFGKSCFENNKSDNSPVIVSTESNAFLTSRIINHHADITSEEIINETKNSNNKKLNKEETVLIINYTKETSDLEATPSNTFSAQSSIDAVEKFRNQITNDACVEINTGYELVNSEEISEINEKYINNHEMLEIDANHGKSKHSFKYAIDTNIDLMINKKENIEIKMSTNKEPQNITVKKQTKSVDTGVACKETFDETNDYSSLITIVKLKSTGTVPDESQTKIDKIYNNFTDTQLQENDNQVLIKKIDSKIEDLQLQDTNEILNSAVGVSEVSSEHQLLINTNESLKHTNYINIHENKVSNTQKSIVDVIFSNPSLNNAVTVPIKSKIQKYDTKAYGEIENKIEPSVEIFSKISNNPNIKEPNNVDDIKTVESSCVEILCRTATNENNSEELIANVDESAKVDSAKMLDFVKTSKPNIEDSRNELIPSKAEYDNGYDIMTVDKSCVETHCKTLNNEHDDKQLKPNVEEDDNTNIKEVSSTSSESSQPEITLKGIEYKHPVIGTCYVFTTVEENISEPNSIQTNDSEMVMNSSEELNETIQDDINSIDLIKNTSDAPMDSPITNKIPKIFTPPFEQEDSNIRQKEEPICSLPSQLTTADTVTGKEEPLCSVHSQLTTADDVILNPTCLHNEDNTMNNDINTANTVDEYYISSPKAIETSENPSFITSKTYRTKCFKRKSSIKDLKIPSKKYRKGKNIDCPKFNSQYVSESSYSKEYKRIIAYVNTVKFSFASHYHKSCVDVDECLHNWPITGPVQSVAVDSAIDIKCELFCDVESRQENPLHQTFVDEITSNSSDNQYPSVDKHETNFNMGFGERSGRVNQNLKDISIFSAATLSDVKQTQPFLQSVDCKRELNAQSSFDKEQSEQMKRYLTYIQLKNKVRSYFQMLKLDLHDSAKSDKYRYSEKDVRRILQNVPGLYGTEFLEPPPLVSLVQVVQVGQLPVSAAAQNPVSCDPRVTQVSDASPSQCSVENSPQSDNNQPTIKAEYTELTTADLSLPLVQDMPEQNQYSKPDDMTDNNDEQLIIPKKEEIKEEPEQDINTFLENNPETIEYQYDSNANEAINISSQLTSDLFTTEPKETSNYLAQKQINGPTEKTDQIAHAMNAAGITTTPETTVTNTRAHQLVNIISQSLLQKVPTSTVQTTANNFSKTSINAMSLQQALASILPPPLNQTSGDGQKTQQVLHIVQGKNASGNQITLVDNSQQSLIGHNATQVLHIVQNKAAGATNGNPNTQGNSFSGLSLVDAGLQQGGNQLLHIVNTGNQKGGNAGQVLKRVNLVTNLTNVQGGNEQKMVQFVCKSADGKAIHLNGPHQRSMVLRLQPIETPNVQQIVNKSADLQDLSPTQAVNNSVSDKDQHGIKSRSVYEENYAKFIQNSSSKSTVLTEKSTSLPKFNQAFGKPVFQDDEQKQNDRINHNNSLTGESAESGETTINLEHIGQISAPPLLLRKTSPTSQSQSNLVQQIKQTIAPMNIQTMHGGVIYTRQIPVNIGSGQTINLITVPSTDLIDESGQKQQNDIKFVSQNEMEPSIIKLVPQNSEGNTEENTRISNEIPQTSQAQPVLTQMRIKLPMLSKTPQISGARVVRPSFFQIQRNVIGGANQPVYQQLVLTAAPPLGQQTIRLPQTRQVNKVPETTASPESHLSSSTLEQLREFDMVLEQVKERSTVQPGTANTFPKLHTSSTDTTDGPASASATVPTSSTTIEHTSFTTQQVLYSIGNTLTTTTMNVAYVNRTMKTVTTPTTSNFVRSPDSSGIADSPSSSSQIPTVVMETAAHVTVESNPHPKQAAKIASKSKSRSHKPSSSMSSSHTPSALKFSHIPPKTSSQKPLEDEQTTQRILYILAEYKEQVENSPDKDKPAPRRRTNPPVGGSHKRKKGRRSGCTRDHSPVGDDSCRTMGSEDSSCGTSQGDCTESCSIETQSPQDSPRKIVRKLSFEPDNPVLSQPRPQPPRNLLVADGQTITVARSATGKPTTAVLMPANYILPVSMVKGGQQIAIVTNRGPKLLTVGGSTGEGGTGNTLLLQRLIGPAALKPMLARPGVRHVRLPTAALHNLQAFNFATAAPVQPPDSTASPAAGPAPPELIETRATSSPWNSESVPEIKPERGSSPETSEPWHLRSSDPPDYTYEEPSATSRNDSVDRTVLDPIPDRYSPDMEAQRIFDKMFDVDAKKAYIGGTHDDSPRVGHGYDIDTSHSDCEDKSYHQVVHKKDGSSHGIHRVTHIASAALRHKYAILEHELRLQKSLSEECEDLGVDSPSASELFPEAELLFSSSPGAHEHPHDHHHHPHHNHHHHAPHHTITIPQPDMDDQIATDRLIPVPRANLSQDQTQLSDVNLGLGDVGIVTVSEDGMQATIQLDQEEFARSHPNTTFHREPTDGEEVQPFSLATGLKGRHITSTIFHSNSAPATVLMTAPQQTVISQAAPETSTGPNTNLKYSAIDNMIHNIPGPHANTDINLSSVLVKDEGLTRFDNILTDSRELHLSNTASAIVHNATQVIRRVCYDDEKRAFLMDDSDALIGDDAKMSVAEDSCSRDATLESIAADGDDDGSSPERHAELFWESNSASEKSESRRPLEYSSDSEKCCKSPSLDETNSTDSSGVGTHLRLDSVIKEARGRNRSGSIECSSAEDTIHPPIRTYPAKRAFHTEGDVERSLTGKTRAGERSPDISEVRRRASGRGVVKRGCHCCNGSPEPPRSKKPRPRKPTLDFNSN